MINREKRHYDIAVLLATHKRTDALSRSISSLLDRANDLASIEFVIGIDNDDDVGLSHFYDVIQPDFDQRGINYQSLGFEPMGYMGLNRYYNTMAKYTRADWLWVWCDDAICETNGWDDRIRECTGEFCILKVHTHNEHPYSIFPIYPVEWYEHLGYLSCHQLIDAECSQLAYLLNIMKIIEIDVTHDRADLTGNNQDENHKKKKYLEGNPGDPRDFHHASFKKQRNQDVNRLYHYMESHGVDTSWWRGVMEGRNDPWKIMLENDPNGQVGVYRTTKNHMGQLQLTRQNGK
jgi:hypothetical protein